MWSDARRRRSRRPTTVIERAHPGRFLLGVGIGHPEATKPRTSSPYATIVDYLDALDAAGRPEVSGMRAGRPRPEGARDSRASAPRGRIPYLTTPEPTPARRATLARPRRVLLAPEQKVVLETDPVAARAIGRPPVDRPYLHLRNYVSSLKRLGWTDADIADGGSDRLIDALAVHGTAEPRWRPA